MKLYCEIESADAEEMGREVSNHRLQKQVFLIKNCWKVKDKTHNQANIKLHLFLVEVCVLTCV